MDKNVKCGDVIKKNWFFGNTVAPHKWVYKTKESRKCKKCNREEMFFGTKTNGHFDYEDWRESGK